MNPETKQWSCPWVKETPPGEFSAERYEILRNTSIDHEKDTHPGLGDPMFACHFSGEGKESACAGWLASQGRAHVRVRLAVAVGELDKNVLLPGKDWPELHETYEDMVAHKVAE